MFELAIFTEILFEFRPIYEDITNTILFGASPMQLLINSTDPQYFVSTYHTISNITFKPYIPMRLLYLIAVSAELRSHPYAWTVFFSSCVIDYHISHARI